MSVSYQKVPPFPFYSLKQFTQLQPLSHSKSTIYLYQHNDSKQIFTVKQIPYSEQAIKTYEIIMKRQSLEGIVRIRGICLMVIKYDFRSNYYENTKQQSQLELTKYQASSLERTEQLQQNSVFKLSTNKNSRRQTQNQRRKIVHRHKQSRSLLIFMEKCQCDLVELITYRRKQKKPFRTEQVMNFVSQTLFLLETLEKDGLSHRDIKPENFLVDHGRFRICDFDDAIYFDNLLENQRQPGQLDLTTLQYTTPQFYKNLKHPKQKLFDPFKLDVYAFGITILFMCSLGRFDVTQRKQYLLQDSVFHNQFMKEQRRKILKNNDCYKGLNTIVKIMLEEDQYKRDTFTTLLLKVKPIMNVRCIGQIICSDPNQMSEDVSDYSKSSQNRTKLNSAKIKKNKKKKTRRSQWPGTTEIQRKSLLSLLIFGLSFFILILIV